MFITSTSYCVVLNKKFPGRAGVKGIEIADKLQGMVLLSASLGLSLSWEFLGRI
jgi:hypothetical protein